MNWFRLKGSSEKVFSSDDTVLFNKDLFQYGFDSVSCFEVEYFGRRVFVDLEACSISVDGSELDLDVGSLEGVRWVHFRRNYASLSESGVFKDKSFRYGVGFQGSLGGVNVQRFVLVGESGFELLKKK